MDTDDNDERVEFKNQKSANKKWMDELIKITNLYL